MQLFHTASALQTVPQLYPCTPGDGQIPSSLLLQTCCEPLGLQQQGSMGSLESGHSYFNTLAWNKLLPKLQENPT